MSSLRKLQLVTALLALVPIVTGVLTMLGIHDPIYRGRGLPADPLLDSNLRFFGGAGSVWGWRCCGCCPGWRDRRRCSGPSGG